MALDDLDDRFATAVKLALAASRSPGDEASDGSEHECPSSDVIASYYEYAVSRVEGERLETHFSGCARCQGTLAALLRAAPMLDNASAAGGLAAAAAHTAAAESAGIRERWFQLSPAWRIAGVSVGAAATLAVVVTGVYLNQGGAGRRSEQMAAASPLSSRRPSRGETPGASSTSETQLALNESRQKNEPENGHADRSGNGSDKKPPVATEPKAAAAPLAPGAPSAAIAAPAVTPPVGSSNVSGDAALPSQDTAPASVAPANSDQNGTAPATAAQAAAALGALAATAVPALSAAPANGSPAAAASIAAAAPPAVARAPVTLPATSSATSPSTFRATPRTIPTGPSGGAVIVPKDNAKAVAAAPIAGAAVEAGAVAAQSGVAGQVAARTSAPGASETATGGATAGASGGANLKQWGLSATASPTPPLEQFSKTTVAPAPPAQATTPRTASTQDQIARDQIAKEQLAQRQLAKEQVAEKKRKADLARQADLDRKAALERKAALAQKAEEAKRDADLKRRIDQTRRETQAKSAAASSASTAPRSQQQAMVPLRGQTASAPPTAQPSAQAGNEIAMADRQVASAPPVVVIAPGIPVAPHAILISPADHSVYWSLQSNGVISRTNDRKSWTSQSTGLQAELLAGMAPTDTVCWAVGRKGAILLTADGTHWERIKSPTTSDVIGIVAASKDVATIFTAGGVTYSTFDGGSNWQQAN